MVGCSCSSTSPRFWPSRLERWHPAPEPFYDVGALLDVGVYPLTLATTMLGPARGVSAWGWDLLPERVTPDGLYTISSEPRIVCAAKLKAAPFSG